MRPERVTETQTPEQALGRHLVHLKTIRAKLNFIDEVRNNLRTMKGQKLSDYVSARNGSNSKSYDAQRADQIAEAIYLNHPKHKTMSFSAQTLDREKKAFYRQAADLYIMREGVDVRQGRPGTGYCGCDHTKSCKKQSCITRRINHSLCVAGMTGMICQGTERGTVVHSDIPGFSHQDRAGVITHTR